MFTKSTMSFSKPEPDRGAKGPQRSTPASCHQALASVTVSFGTLLSQLPGSSAEQWELSRGCVGGNNYECKNMCASWTLVLLPGSPIIKWLSSKYNASEDRQPRGGEERREGVHHRAEEEQDG